MSSNVFYRKYRPLTFADVHGQTHVKSVLIQSVIDDSFSHGYLFAGPRGTGKTSMARIFAKAINSENFKKNKDVGPEDKNFQAISNGESVDIIEMDAASNRGIEDVRELKENVNFLPASLKYKVYIIDEAHMLTKEAFNALLKTLEEPPEHVVFILATTEPHKIPVTIHSRVIRFDFNLADKEQLADKLRTIAKEEGIDITDDAIDKIHRISEGSFRDSESILAKLASQSKKIDTELVYEVLGIPTDDIIQMLVNILLYKTEEISDFIAAIERKNIPVNVLIEDTIDYVLYRANISNKKEIVNFLVNVLENLNYFKNSYQYLHAKLFTFISGEETSISETKLERVPEIKIETQVAEPEPKITAKVEVEIKHEEPPKETISSTPSTQIADVTGLIAELEKVDMRLAVILEASYLELSENTVIICNEFKFNLNYIEKFIPKIIEVAKISFNLPAVQVKTLQENRLIKVEVAANDKIEEEEVIEDKVSEDSDNTDLVESIL